MWRNLFNKENGSKSLIQEIERSQELREHRIEKLKALLVLAEESNNEEAIEYAESRLRILERLRAEAEVLQLERGKRK